MPFHIHAPKPLHGWRAFFGEIAVIVIGVLIALAAEEAVTEWNWERKVVAGEKGLAAEQSDDFFYLAENVTVAPCVDAQLAKLNDRLVARETPWRPAPLITQGVLDGVVRAPWRPTENGAWTAMVADGSSSHMEMSRQQLNLSFYNQLSVFAPSQESVRGMIDRLRVLSEPLDLDARSRTDIMQEIDALRGTVQGNALLARQMMATIERLHHMPAEAELDEYVGSKQSGTAVYCRKSGFPLGDWRKELKQGLSET